MKIRRKKTVWETVRGRSYSCDGPGYSCNARGRRSTCGAPNKRNKAGKTVTFQDSRTTTANGVPIANKPLKPKMCNTPERSADTDSDMEGDNDHDQEVEDVHVVVVDRVTQDDDDSYLNVSSFDLAAADAEDLESPRFVVV